jgi:hypothetical protein
VVAGRIFLAVVEAVRLIKDNRFNIVITNVPAIGARLIIGVFLIQVAKLAAAAAGLIRAVELGVVLLTRCIKPEAVHHRVVLQLPNA